MSYNHQVDARVRTQSMSKQWAVLVKTRPAGEPHPIMGGSILFFIFLIFALLIWMWS